MWMQVMRPLKADTDGNGRVRAAMLSRRPCRSSGTIKVSRGNERECAGAGYLSAGLLLT